MYDNFAEDFDAFTRSWWPYVVAFIISIVSAIRLYVGGTKYQSSQRIDGKIVVITGGSGGIGLETAKNLAARGAQIVLAVRNAHKGKRAIETIKRHDKSAEVVVKIVDLSEMSSIRNFADQLQAEYSRIDILINNAAVIYEPYKQTVDGVEHTLMVNYLGPFLLTHLLLPLLNKSDNGRIINVSAMAHYSGRLRLDDLNMEKNYDEKDAFSQSKLALTIFTKYLASLLNGTKITCNAVSPGLVRGTNHLNKLPLQRSFLSKLMVCPWMWLFLKTPKQGCQSIVYLAVDSSLNNVSGYYFSDCVIQEPSGEVKKVNLTRTLYKKSCDIVGINGRTIVDALTDQDKLTVVNEQGDNDDF